MTKELLKRLEQYKEQEDLPWYMVAERLQIPENYIYRWRKKGQITGVYKRIVEEFLEKSL